MTDITPLLGLFGKQSDDAEMTVALAGLPSHQADRPNDGAQYLVSKGGGFDLLRAQYRLADALAIYLDTMEGFENQEG